MSSKAVLAFVAAIFASATPAQQTTSVTDVRETLHRFAQCLVVREKGRVAQMVALPVGSPESERVTRRLFETTDETCLEEGAVDYNPTLFRGAVFDALYRREFGYGGPTAFAPEAAGPVAPALQAFGECVSRAEPGEARKLLLAAPGSATESAQFSALNPRIAACVVKGSTVTMSKSAVRGAIAEGMYRLSRASGTPK